MSSGFFFFFVSNHQSQPLTLLSVRDVALKFRREIKKKRKLVLHLLVW